MASEIGSHTNHGIPALLDRVCVALLAGLEPGEDKQGDAEEEAGDPVLDVVMPGSRSRGLGSSLGANLLVRPSRGWRAR